MHWSSSFDINFTDVFEAKGGCGEFNRTNDEIAGFE